jgi:hypothetical protein
MNTKSQTKILSKVFPISRKQLAYELIILSLLGALAVVLRAKLRIPLNMPGHHGLEVMALLIGGRMFSKIPIASSISTFAAALCIYIPFLGFKDPFLPAIYLALGISIDVLFWFSKKIGTNFLLFAIIGGIAYTLIPAIRLFLHSLGAFEYVLFIKRGLIIPFITHFAFGFAGGLTAASLHLISKKKK